MVAIDLGSNTLRALEFDRSSKEKISEFEKIVKSADGLAKYGYINDEAIKRVILAIREAQDKMDFSLGVKAVTTEALRRASNSTEALSYIKQETGVEFEIISGEEEARLTLLAVKDRLEKLDILFDSFFLVDIGGGSTELSFIYNKKIISRSFPIGIVTIAQSYNTLEEIESALFKEMRDIKIFVKEIYNLYGKVNSFVATAGTPTTIASIKLGMSYVTYDSSKINGTIVKKDDLDITLKELLSMTSKEQEIAVGVGRIELIKAGILIYKHLFTIGGFNKSIVIDDGLREGVALDY